jgi:hypothetical protein
MTIVSDMIRRAYRKSNLIPIGATPTTAEQAEGLELLDTILVSTVGSEIGEQLDTIVVGNNNISRPQGYPWYNQVPDNNNWFLPPNVRMALNLTAAQTVYLDPNPNDGQRFGVLDKSGNIATYPLTVVANGRTLKGLPSIVFNTNGENSEYLYREDLGDWVKITPLAPSDIFPMPDEFDDFFIIALAMQLNPSNSVDTDPEMIGRYNKLNRQISARYRQHVQMGSELGLLRTPGTRYRYWGNDAFGNSAFNSGYPYPWNYRYLG